MVFPLLIGTLCGLVMLAIGSFMMAGEKHKEGRLLLSIGGLLLFGSLGLLAFSLWVFASGM